MRNRLRVIGAAVLSLAASLTLLLPSMGGVASAAGTNAPVGFIVTGQHNNVIELATRSQFPQVGTDWFDNRHLPFVLQSPHYYLIHGQDVSGQYRYPYTLTAHNDVVAAVESAINPASHEELVEVGLINSVPKLPNSTGKAASNTTSATSSSTDPSQTGYFETVWQDPVGIVMNYVEDYVSFSWTNSTMDSAYGWDDTYAEGPSGWKETSHSNGGYWGSGNQYYDEWTGADFENDWWCPTTTFGGPSTYIYYDTNNAIAFPGGMSGNVDTWATGGCTSEMHYYTVLNGALYSGAIY